MNENRLPIITESAHRPDLPEEKEHEVSLGNEMHGAVYAVAGLAYSWVLMIAWFAFSAHNGVELDLSIVTVIFAIFMGLSLLAYALARSHLHRHLPSWDEFIWSKVSTATGVLSGWEAGMQIMIIPLALAFAATAFGLVYALTPSSYVLSPVS